MTHEQYLAELVKYADAIFEAELKVTALKENRDCFIEDNEDEQAQYKGRK